MNESGLMRAIQLPLSQWHRQENARSVYFILNKINNRIYVGSAKKLRARLWRHYSDLSKNIHHCAFLQRDFNVCGADSFIVGVLVYISDDKNLLSAEQRQIDFYDKENRLYNACKVAGNCEGSKMSEETKRKIAKSNTGSKRTAETRARISESKRGIFTARMRQAVNESSIKRRFVLSREQALSFIERNNAGETMLSIMKSHGKGSHHTFLREIRRYFPYYRAKQRGFQCQKQS